MAIIEGSSYPKSWTGYYDFDVDGGAESAIVLRSNDGPLPAGSYIYGGVLDVDTSCASATGTMALHVQTANDIVTAVGQGSWTAAKRDVIPDATGSTAIELTAARTPTLTIATAPFTAGKFTLILFYR